jgi:hypothetical protein
MKRSKYRAGGGAMKGSKMRAGGGAMKGSKMRPSGGAMMMQKGGRVAQQERSALNVGNMPASSRTQRC